MSSMHKTLHVATDGKRLPETVDSTMQQSMGWTSWTKRLDCTLPRPLQVFYNILNIVAINAVIVCNAVLNKNMSRKYFILQMKEALSKTPTDDITEDDPIDAIPASGSKRMRERSKCQIQCKKNKNSNMCSKCHKYCCGKCIGCSPITCKNCC